MAIVTVKAYSESTSDFKVTKKEVLISIVQESVWSTQFHLSIPTPNEDTNRIQVTCLFCAEEAYFLSHDRQILPLSSKASPPFPVGCILWLQEGDMLCQIDLPKYPHLRLCKQGNQVTATFVIQDRLGSGLILWGDSKIRNPPIINKQIHIRVNRLRSLQEAAWLEPYPNGARSVICLTDHPDFDTVPKLRLQHELFSENSFRITKGVFPSSDYGSGKMEPGLDIPEYKNYIDKMYESGSEIAYHGLSPRKNLPSLSECLRRIQMMSMYSPKTWIDHGCGAYLFSRDAVFKEGDGLLDILSKVGIENYWSYTDVWENPVRHLDVWEHRKVFSAFSNFLSFLWDTERVSAPLMAYYGSSVYKNLLSPNHLHHIKEPWRMGAWKLVAEHNRRLRYYHENPMVLYDLSGQSSLMSDQSIWVFDTVLLNHLAFQLRPANIDLLCQQNGLLVAHCYFGHQRNRYGTMNCFVNDGNQLSLIPEFIEAVKNISEKQSQRELVTLPFNALRNALTNFVNASLIRTSTGWEIKAINAIVVSQNSIPILEPIRQWCKGKLYYAEVEGQSVLPMPVQGIHHDDRIPVPAEFVRY